MELLAIMPVYSCFFRNIDLFNNAIPLQDPKIRQTFTRKIQVGRRPRAKV